MTNTEKRRLKRENKRKRKNFLFLLILIIVVILTTDQIIQSYGLVKIKPKDISYCELIRFSDGSMKSVKDKKKIKKLVRKLNTIRGDKESPSDNEDYDVSFVYIYDKAYKKYEISKKGPFMTVNGTTYRIGIRGSEKFDEIFKEFIEN